MSRIRSRPPTIRLLNNERADKIFLHTRHLSMDSQNNMQQKLVMDKENMYPKVELEKKLNNPLVSERRMDMTRFSQRLEHAEKLLQAHYEYKKTIMVPKGLL